MEEITSIGKLLNDLGLSPDDCWRVVGLMLEIKDKYYLQGRKDIKKELLKFLENQE